MDQASVFQRRRAGVLLHITSLPSGNIGKDAYRFIDFLHSTGVTVWQMLPIGPTHNDKSPYQCLSAHGASSDLLCKKTITMQPWAKQDELDTTNLAILIAHAYQQFEANASDEEKQKFAEFCQHNAYWLDDYVLFCEIRHLNYTKSWYNWPRDLRERDPDALDEIIQTCQQALDIRRFEQFQFFEQWSALKRYANEKGILLFGDMPIFVAHDSADVWANRELFTLDSDGHATRVAGVPPDYFSETGQRWGNPLYEWQKHIEQDFFWWQQRIQTQLQLFDLIRIDHFRGFEACWEIPASCETAVDGQWVKAPGEALFDKMLAVFKELPVVAEDLGIITEEVTALREKFAMPGMKILQFAFGDNAENPYLPHQHCINTVAYTGTHDNNTTVGWYNEINDVTREHIRAYFAGSDEAMPWLLNRAALQSVAALAILPMQDILSLDGKHRMNVPGTTEGNWVWQFSWSMLSEDSAAKLKKMNKLYGRG
jgi:4-alpha-glucanotransferase